MIDSNEREIVQDWRMNIRLLKHIYQDIVASGIYSSTCEQNIAKYQQLKKEINELTSTISKSDPKIAELLQIENQQLATSNLGQTCKTIYFERNPIF